MSSVHSLIEPHQAYWVAYIVLHSSVQNASILNLNKN